MCDSHDNVFVLGTFIGSLEFDKINKVQATSLNAFVAKIESNQVVAWVNSYNISSNSKVIDAALAQPIDLEHIIFAAFYNTEEKQYDLVRINAATGILDSRTTMGNKIDILAPIQGSSDLITVSVENEQMKVNRFDKHEKWSNSLQVRFFSFKNNI